MSNLYDWRTVMRERVTMCGEYLIIQYYPAKALSENKSRQQKYRTSRDVQKRLNAKNSQRRLTALVHQNFTPSDVVATLTYDKDHLPKDEKTVQTAFYNFIRRFKRAWSKETGKPANDFKYVEVVEIGRKGRIHHHIIITGGAELHRIKKVWKNGEVKAEYARFDENGITSYVKYITKNNAHIRYKRWSASKNLEKPQITTRDETISITDARFIGDNPLGCEAFIEELHNGYKVCPYSVEVSAFAGLHTAPYISLMMYKSDCRYIQHTAPTRTHHVEITSQYTDKLRSDRLQRPRGHNSPPRQISTPLPKMLQ